MKRLFFVLLFLICAQVTVLAQADPGNKLRDTAVSHKDTPARPAAKTSTVAAVTATVKTENTSTKEVPFVPHKITSDWMTLILVLIPIAVFAWIFYVFRKEMSQIKLSEALSENTTSKVTVKNDQYKIDEIRSLIEKMSSGSNGGTTDPNQSNSNNGVSAAVLMNLATVFPPTIDISAGTTASGDAADNRKYRPSSSRIIAFMAGILTLVLALSMSCFFIFFYCTTGQGPDLSKLFAIIVALGLGMAPYAVNKITGVVDGQKSDT